MRTAGTVAAGTFAESFGATSGALVRQFLAEVRDGWTQAAIERFFAPDYRRHLTPTGPHLTREEQRERATVYMHGLNEMYRQWKGGKVEKSKSKSKRST